MAFWGKGKAEKKRAYEQEKQHQRIMANQEKIIANGLRKAVRDVVTEHLNRAIKNSLSTAKITYARQADHIAMQIDQTGRSKQEVFALAYRQVRDGLSLKNTCVADGFTAEKYQDMTVYYHWGGRTHSTRFNLIDQFTNEDHQAYFEAHIKPLNQIIEDLETQALEKRLYLLRQQQTTENIKNRIDHLQTHQQARENKLDQQLEAVDAQIAKIQQALTRQKRTPKPEHSVDIDRLENMLDELRRLKNGMDE